MQLGRIKDQLDAVLDCMDECDPTSEAFETLTKRANDLRKIIQDEEERQSRELQEREKEERELAAHEDDISERKKDRLVKVLLGFGAGFIGIASIFADETRVICKSGLETIDKMKRIVR